MIVEDFNTDKGLYIFRFDNVETEFHSHPTIEIIVAENGIFTLWTTNAEYKNLKFAVIDANQKHKLSSTDCALTVIMIEHHNKPVKDILALNGISLTDGIYGQTIQKDEANISQEISQKINDSALITEYDERVLAIINYLNNNNIDYSQMIKSLQNVTNLSESRLSHLFKNNLGISLKRYLIWTKLKSTIKQHLHKQDDLFSSLMDSGFYDQPHFCRHFKAMLGVKPTKAYNSRTVQVSLLSAS